MSASMSMTGLAQQTWIRPWLIATAFILGSLANPPRVTAQPPPPSPTPPALSKAFMPTTIPSGGSSALSFTVTNSNTSTTLTGIAFTDSLPSGIMVSTPNGLTGSCGGGTITAMAGSGSISLTGATLAGGASCTFSVNVTGTEANNYENTTGAITSDQGTGNTAMATLKVVAPPEFSKKFGDIGILLGATTSLTFQISNPNDALTGLAFSDTLPAGLVVATPNGLMNGCGGTVTATAGSSSISLTGGTIPGTDSCTISVNVTGVTAGVKNNSTSTLTSNEAPSAGPATDVLTVIAPPSISKQFGAATIPFGGTTTLTFDIQNPNGTVILDGVAFSDTLPAGLVVATPNGLTGSCGGGTITATAGSSSISLTGATLTFSAECTFSVNVVGISAGVQLNVTAAITSTNGGTGNAASAGITVVLPPTFAKTFGASTLPVGARTTLTFVIANPNTTVALTGVAFNDVLPAGLLVSTPNHLTGSCGGGAITAAAGSSSISLTGATLAASTSCTFSVDVTGTKAGTQSNLTSKVTSTNGGTGNGATASIVVIVNPVPVLQPGLLLALALLLAAAGWLALARAPRSSGKDPR